MTKPENVDECSRACGCSSALEVIPRLLDVGCKIAKQDGQWWIFEHDGEGVVGGSTFSEMCDKLASVDVEDHERRYLERCRWYMENRDRLLGRQ
jgi:hypothetical protein